jgi:phi13 family phage major tail protein
MAKIGMKDVHYAILTNDDETGVQYEAPVKLPGAISAKISVKTNTDTLYADDGAFETATTLGEITVEIELADLPLSAQAALLGHKLENGILKAKATDEAPYVALGFKALKSNGKYRYYWLLKGRFQIPDDESQTREDKVTFKTGTLSGVFVCRQYDGLWKLAGDEDEQGFLATNWFDVTTINASAGV